MVDILYPCNPNKNVACNKRGCFINGGPCQETRHIEYADIAPVKVQKGEVDAKLVRFAEWVADWILRGCFEECAGGFAELACRRLEDLGIMRKKGNLWVRNVPDKNVGKMDEVDNG